MIYYQPQLTSYFFYKNLFSYFQAKEFPYRDLDLLLNRNAKHLLANQLNEETTRYFAKEPYPILGYRIQAGDWNVRDIDIQVVFDKEIIISYRKSGHNSSATEKTTMREVASCVIPLEPTPKPPIFHDQEELIKGLNWLLLQISAGIEADLTYDISLIAMDPDLNIELNLEITKQGEVMDLLLGVPAHAANRQAR